MDFKFFGDNAESGVVQVPVITAASRKDHGDIHYLYKLRKALVLLVGEESLKGFTEDQLRAIHIAVVRSLVDSGTTHWWDDWDSDLDESLPEDLKIASDGYNPPIDSSLFDLEDPMDKIYVKLLEEHDAVKLWTAPTKREKIPSHHFLDKKNKKYPYKNSDGTINCGGLKTAIAYTGGARGAPKRLTLKAKAQKLYSKHCEKKKTKDVRVGKLLNIKEI